MAGAAALRLVLASTAAPLLARLAQARPGSTPARRGAANGGRAAEHRRLGLQCLLVATRRTGGRGFRRRPGLVVPVASEWCAAGGQWAYVNRSGRGVGRIGD